MNKQQQIKQALKEQLRKGINSIQSYSVEELINKKIKVSIYNNRVIEELKLKGVSFGTIVGLCCDIKDIQDIQDSSIVCNSNGTYYSIRLNINGISIPGDVNGYERIHYMYIGPTELGNLNSNFTNPWSFELYHIGSKYTGFVELLD